MINEFVFWIAVILTVGFICVFGIIWWLEAQAIKCKNGK